MTSSIKKELFSPELLPTPSPSPPTTSQDLPDPMSSAITSTRRPYTEAERQAHLILARQCAEQLMKLHLANGAQVEEGEGKEIRYHVEVERTEGDQRVKRRVAVIVPQARTQHFKQHQLPSLTLVPPPHLGVSPSKKLSLFPHSKNSLSPSRNRTIPSKRLSLPSLRSLCLLPTTTPAPSPFRSRKLAPLPSRTPHSSPPKHHPHPHSLLSTPQIPKMINLETSSKLLQRRKAALVRKFESRTSSSSTFLPPSPPRTDSSTSTPSSREEKVVNAEWTNKRKRQLDSFEGEEDSVRSKCARWARHVRSSTSEEETEKGSHIRGGVKRERVRAVSLGERRGRKLSALVII